MRGAEIRMVHFIQLVPLFPSHGAKSPSAFQTYTPHKGGQSIETCFLLGLTSSFVPFPKMSL